MGKWVSSNKKKMGQKVAILFNRITHPFKTKLLGHSTKPLLCPSNILERVRDPTSCYKTITLYYNNSKFLLIVLEKKTIIRHYQQPLLYDTNLASQCKYKSLV